MYNRETSIYRRYNYDFPLGRAPFLFGLALHFVSTSRQFYWRLYNVIETCWVEDYSELLYFENKSTSPQRQKYLLKKINILFSLILCWTILWCREKSFERVLGPTDSKNLSKTWVFKLKTIILLVFSLISLSELTWNGRHAYRGAVRPLEQGPSESEKPLNCEGYVHPNFAYEATRACGFCLTENRKSAEKSWTPLQSSPTG